MSEAFAPVDIIIAKRDGRELTDAQIDWVVDAYTRGHVADEQMSALGMAILLNGMNKREIVRWTEAMIATGARMDFSDFDAPSVDKHSTGGVGDKVTLPLVPIVAACGAVVPQLSGRGLGYFGGTLDKMESIPGWRALLSNDEMKDVMRVAGGVICAAGDGLAPADKKLYALRDVTGTVEAIPLIASSIMSKKIAEGADNLVLDVKTGNGAFMSDLPRARELARTMVAIGNDAGVRTRALITAMDVPLGLAVGNAVEVAESVEVLAGGGPQDLIDLVIALATEMLEMAGIDADPNQAITSGRAMDHWRAMVSAQGGDPDASLPQAKHEHVITAPESGTLTTLEAYGVGVASWRLGAGRAHKDGTITHGAGIRLHAKPGDHIMQGQPLMTLLADDESKFPAALTELDGAYEINGEPLVRLPLIVERITQ
jgi:thymidine phosphorylase